MLAKIWVASIKQWLFGKIIGNEFELPSGRRFPIDDDGNVNFYGEKCKLLNADYLPD